MTPSPPPRAEMAVDGSAGMAVFMSLLVALADKTSAITVFVGSAGFGYLIARLLWTLRPRAEMDT